MKLLSMQTIFVDIDSYDTSLTLYFGKRQKKGNMAFTTSKSIIEKVCSGDDVGWGEFYSTYRPLVWLRGSDYNLTHSEQDDLMQQVMMEFFKQSKRFKYNPEKGRFRDYFRTIVSHQALRIKAKRSDNNCSLDNEKIESLGTDDRVEEAWDNEWQVFIVNQSLIELKKRLDDHTYQAFDLYAIQGGPPKQVAQFLGTSVSNVYIAKSRALKLLKEIISDMHSSEDM